MYPWTITVANTILKASFKNNIRTNPMKLQRLVYLFFCGYLQETDKLLFTEQFQTWDYGPVVASIQGKFGCYRALAIKNYAHAINRAPKVIDLSQDAAARHVISDIEAIFLPKSGIELSEITRMPGSAWYKAFQAGHEQLSLDDIKTDPCFKKYIK